MPAGLLRPTILNRQFGPPGSMPPPALQPAPQQTPARACPEPGRREKVARPKVKADPKHVAAARELRDRWLEHVNSGATVIESAGKYDVTRALPASSAVEFTTRPHPSPLPEGEGVRGLLPAA